MQQLVLMSRDGTGDSMVKRSIPLSGQLDHLGNGESQRELLLKGLSGLMVKQRQESVLMSMVHSTTREHGDIPGRGSFWGLQGCPGIR